MNTLTTFDASCIASITQALRAEREAELKQLREWRDSLLEAIEENPPQNGIVMLNGEAAKAAAKAALAYMKGQGCEEETVEA